MAPLQLSLSVQLSREWRIKRPRLYRYMPRRYVDAFFETGQLRLSSFHQFSKHTDEQRGDISEGTGILVHQDKRGEGQTIMAAMQHGIDAYVLCTAMYYSQGIADAFQTDSGFRINNIIEFANAIARHVPGFSSGIEGHCHYVERRELHLEGEQPTLEELKSYPGAGTYDMEKMWNTISTLAGDELPFLKNMRYASQSEYRLLWLSVAKMQPFIDIVCPEAVQFCTRFEQLKAEVPG